LAVLGGFLLVLRREIGGHKNGQMLQASDWHEDLSKAASRYFQIIELLYFWTTNKVLTATVDSRSMVRQL